jgi:hypothetical protein
MPIQMTFHNLMKAEQHCEIYFGCNFQLFGEVVPHHLLKLHQKQLNSLDCQEMKSKTSEKRRKCLHFADEIHRAKRHTVKVVASWQPELKA